MDSDKVVAKAVGGKTARACDSCIHKRARWYCAADDAFLCQACDTSVHSANPLARRHERVRLKTASFKLSDEASVENSAPSWHRGFTRKARTPRHRTNKLKSEEHIRNPCLDLVPEDENSSEENEEQLLYRVPVFDLPNSEPADSNGSESKAMLGDFGQEIDNLHGFLPSDKDLAEFAANVESLLGRGLENDCFGVESLGMNDCEGKDCVGSGKVKFEDEERVGMDMVREPFELSFDYDSSPATCGEEEEEKVAAMMKKSGDEKRKNKLLRLDYEAVIKEWKNEGSSWFRGDRPELDPTNCWPDFMGGCGTEVYRSGMRRDRTMGDGGREARVSRYREKRRTRLFSKKIRYEVRKLNAEKRPRIKGRFVKRSSFAPPTITNN